MPAAAGTSSIVGETLCQLTEMIEFKNSLFPQKSTLEEDEMEINNLPESETCSLTSIKAGSKMSWNVEQLFSHGTVRIESHAVVPFP